MSEYDKYWESEEFEDLVTRSIIGLNENNVKRLKKAPKPLRFNEDVFSSYKKIGCYFPPGDRVIRFVDDEKTGRASWTQEIDIINDGLPDRATYTHLPGDDASDCYLHTFYLERIPSLPRLFGSDIKGKYYRIMQMFFENKCVSGCGSIIVVDKEGNVQSCYMEGVHTDSITGRSQLIKNRPVNDNPLSRSVDYYCVWASVTIQTYQDRRFLWNVQAQDGVAKSTFGVYPEQIQSLFYARDLPETGTGRKRPILHWVNSHQRRMKSGTEVDIEKYLRGTHEFVMNGTKFKITNPVKAP